MCCDEAQRGTSSQSVLAVDVLFTPNRPVIPFLGMYPNVTIMMFFKKLCLQSCSSQNCIEQLTTRYKLNM